MLPEELIGQAIIIIEDWRPHTQEGFQPENAIPAGTQGVLEGNFPRLAMYFEGEGRTSQFDYQEFIGGIIRGADGQPLAQTGPLYVGPAASGNRLEITHPIGGGPTTEKGTFPFWNINKAARIRLANGEVIWDDECQWKLAG